MNQQARRLPWLNGHLCLEFREKKNLLSLKKDQVTQENYKDVVRLCREKVKRAKAQLELNLATARYDNKNVSINALAVKGQLRRISSLY